MDGVQSGIAVALGGANTDPETAVEMENFPPEPLAMNNLFEILDVARRDDGLAS